MSSTAPAETMLGTVQAALEQEIRISGRLMVVLSRRPVEAWGDEEWPFPRNRSCLWGTGDASLGFRAGLKQHGV